MVRLKVVADARQGEALIVPLGPAPGPAGDQGQAVGHEQPAFGEDVQRPGVLAALAVRAPLRPAHIDELLGVQIADAIPDAAERVGAQAEQLPLPVEPAEGAVVAALLVDDLEDRVVQILPRAIDARPRTAVPSFSRQRV